MTGLLRKIAIGLGVLLLFTLAGCGGKKETPSSGAPQGTEGQKSYKIVFALHSQPNTTEHEAAKKFKETVESKSGGKITVDIFPGSTLGGEKDQLEQIKVGEIQMSIFGDLLPSQLAPEYAATIIPFVFPNVDAVYAYWDSPIGKEMKKVIEQNGNVLVVGLQRRGARNLTANKPVRTPEDLQGLKLRVPEIPSWVTVWKSMGALPTPIAYNELYNALQTKVVDAQENPYENIYSSKLYEVQKYLINTEHLFNVFHWAMSKKFYDSLPSDLQKLVLDAAKEASQWGDSEAAKKDSEIFNQLKGKMEVIQVNKADFRKKALAGIKEVAKTWAPGVYDAVKQYIE